MIANGSRWSETVASTTGSSRTEDCRVLCSSCTPMLSRSCAQDYGDPADGISLPISHEGQGRIIKDPGRSQSGINGNSMGPDGDSVAAYDNGIILSIGTICIFSMIPRSFPGGIGRVASGPDDGDHESSGSCAGRERPHVPLPEYRASAPSPASPSSSPNRRSEDELRPAGGLLGHPPGLNLMAGGGKGTWEVDLATDGNGSINVD